jgi:hypothetical protein
MSILDLVKEMLGESQHHNNQLQPPVIKLDIFNPGDNLYEIFKSELQHELLGSHKDLFRRTRTNEKLWLFIDDAQLAFEDRHEYFWIFLCKKVRARCNAVKVVIAATYDLQSTGTCNTPICHSTDLHLS